MASGDAPHRYYYECELHGHTITNELARVTLGVNIPHREI